MKYPAIRIEPKNAPAVAGVYIFRNDTEVFYVGKAENLQKRLRSHPRIVQLNREGEDFFVEIIQTAHRNEVEQQLIAGLKPFLNRKPFGPRPHRQPPKIKKDWFWEILHIPRD